MHPILFEIPLSYWTIAIVGVLFAVGGVIRTRFVQNDKDASYLATFLGLNVKWGQIAAPWDKAITQGLLNGGFAAVITYAVKYVAQTRFQTTTIPLHIYGLMMATAFIVGIWAAMREAKHEQMPAVPYLDKNGKQYKDKSGNPVFLTAADMMSDLAFYLLLAGLGGARLLYIFTRWDTDYAPDPKRIFMFWQGGLVWYGGLIGATLVTVWFIRKHKVAFLPYGDAIVPGVSVAHAIGRLGCFAAGCCFGNVASPNFPFSVQFPAGSPAAMEHFPDAGAYTLSRPVYPTQIMESLGEVLIFMILLRIRTRKRFHGQVLLTYFFLYASLRTVMEMFRGDTIRGFFFRWPTEEHPMLLSTSQGVSVLMAVVGLVLTVTLIRQRNRTAALHAAT